MGQIFYIRLITSVLLIGSSWFWLDTTAGLLKRWREKRQTTTMMEFWEFKVHLSLSLSRMHSLSGIGCCHCDTLIISTEPKSNSYCSSKTTKWLVIYTRETGKKRALISTMAFISICVSCFTWKSSKEVVYDYISLLRATLLPLSF